MKNKVPKNYINDTYHDLSKEYRFDKKSMEAMAKEAERIFATFEMNEELDELEEENYEALSEKYKSYSTLELIKKLFE